MNDESDPRTRLLAETLQGDWETGPAAAMARRAAAQARRQRTIRRAGFVLAMAGAVVLFTFRAVPPVAPPPEPVAKRGFEIISDEELLAHLPSRPLLEIPQPDGSNTLVVLDR